MALEKYKQKRSFTNTPEPTGGKPNGDVLQFVIQKHAASHLHYDFRLEAKGVLLSWAVPKGPSMNPDEKHLAMHVEDHPFDYKDFEGIIPKGNYGAGTVIVWDRGNYTPEEDMGDKKLNEKEVIKSFYKGTLKFKLNGEKLKGSFALVKTAQRGENAWLLMKLKDKFAKKTDITKKDASVISGKTLEQMAANKSASKWISNRSSNGKPKSEQPEKNSSPTQQSKSAGQHSSEQWKPDIKKILSGLSAKKKSAMPKDLQPMLATLVNKPFDEEGWQYEVKWDGYRAIAYKNKKNVDIKSRNNKSFNETYYPVYSELQQWGINAVVDGEIILANDNGHADFEGLQTWRSEADGQLLYYLFDLLWLEGYDVTMLPLKERREILSQIIPPESELLKFSENFNTTATAFFNEAAKVGLEGIVAKKESSIYEPGKRSNEWVKVKAEKTQEAIICGYTKNEGTSRTFSALLLGMYKNGELEFTGVVGTGFSKELQEDMVKQFQKVKSAKCPFKEVPDYNKPSRFRPNPPKASVTWLKPKLVCTVSFQTISPGGALRHPTFKGLRPDKAPEEVVLEQPSNVEDVKKNTRKSPAKKSGDVRKTLLNPTDETQVRKIDGAELKFSNLSKLYWPDDNVTKRDMLNYYYQVAPYILPYLKDRPQSLNRYPNGIKGHSFYHKDLTVQAPDWMKLFPYHTSDGQDKNFMVPEDEKALLYMANLGAIEMNPWNSTVQKPDHPDWCLIDLDPTEKNSFEQVIETALATKSVLDELGITGFPKTSGSTGIHIYIPLAAKYTYDECQLFGKVIATHVHARLPKFTSIERLTKNRKGKIYVDYLQNRPKATLAAPYSLRPKPGATVSMPLHWDEVKKGLKMRDFNISNAMDRIKSNGDIFKPVLGKGVNIKKALTRLNGES